MSLRARLLAAAVLLLATLALSGYLIVRTVENSELAQVDNQLTSTVPVALRIARNASQPAPPTPTVPTNSLSDRYLAVIADGYRTTILAPEAANGQAPSAPRAVATSITSAHPETVGSVHGPGRWRAILIRTPDGREDLVAVYMGAVDATASQLRTAVFVAGGLVAVVLLAAAFWIERLGLRPIARMKRVAEAVVAGDRKRRVTPEVLVGETADLAAALDSMLDQQHATEDRLRQFVADASHELRTPTSVISGLAQLWRQGDLREGSALEDAMRRIGQESSRMTALVEELLLLARLDEGMPLRPDTVDLADLVHDVVSAAGSTHPSRTMSVELVEGNPVEGEEPALRRVVSNLVTNALTHTPPASPITVKLSRHDDDVVLEVSDAGPGMTAEEADHAFDRFWRGDASRTRTGSGLGLPIVKAIVSAHRGTIHFNSDPERGTTARVVLPTAARPRTEAAAGTAGGDVRPSRRAAQP